LARSSHLIDEVDLGQRSRQDRLASFARPPKPPEGETYSDFTSRVLVANYAGADQFYARLAG
jgi:hypothetical protein